MTTIKTNNQVLDASAIILAGGSSSRMNQDKSMLEVDGIPLVSHIKDQLDQLFPEVLIGANNPDKYSFLNCRIIPDKVGGQGPLMGLLSCLLASANEVNFITACDIPHMHIPMIRTMLQMSKEADVVVPIKDQYYEPLFAIYRKTVTGDIEGLLNRGQNSIVKLFDLVSIKTLPFSDQSWYYNLNTLSDYRAYLQGKRAEGNPWP